MSGHSKWSTIKRKKGVTDARRGKIFSKLAKEITMAARLGGGDPSANPRLRAAVSTARAENMPKEKIERAIKKGTGEQEGVAFEEVYYEGYGPGGAAVLVKSLTDNKNRAVADIRHAFSKAGGNLAEDFEQVKKALDERGLRYVLGEVTMVPKSTVKVEGKEAEQMLRLMDSLEDSEDVQKVYSNFDIPDSTLEALGGV